MFLFTNRFGVLVRNCVDFAWHAFWFFILFQNLHFKQIDPIWFLQWVYQLRFLFTTNAETLCYDLTYKRLFFIIDILGCLFRLVDRESLNDCMELFEEHVIHKFYFMNTTISYQINSISIFFLRVFLISLIWYYNNRLVEIGENNLEFTFLFYFLLKVINQSINYNIIHPKVILSQSCNSNIEK